MDIQTDRAVAAICIDSIIELIALPVLSVLVALSTPIIPSSHAVCVVWLVVATRQADKYKLCKSIYYNHLNTIPLYEWHFDFNSI